MHLNLSLCDVFLWCNSGYVAWMGIICKWCNTLLSSVISVWGYCIWRQKLYVRPFLVLLIMVGPILRRPPRFPPLMHIPCTIPSLWVGVKLWISLLWLGYVKWQRWRDSVDINKVANQLILSYQKGESIMSWTWPKQVNTSKGLECFWGQKFQVWEGLWREGVMWWGTERQSSYAVPACLSYRKWDNKRVFF